MKENTHPNYREVVFQDMSSDFSFVTRSTIQTKESIVWKDGKEYPLAKIEVCPNRTRSTRARKIMDTAGRVEKFRQKSGSKAGKAAK